ncbi:hypothetical protein JCM19237_6824 [Photobacterium aphoticum]|uniref:Uncharacterized protein n=1 Tax=Photobacterium aphoticum TaxID=754436 RepID=A0A090RKQ3_9GAMM|nr:hypothetical protein JCM19237_6824 [Photobacterium aphoticum]
MQHHFATKAAYRIDFDIGRSAGHDDGGADASCWPDRANPWAWLPADAAMTPAWRCASVSWAIML